MEKNSVITGVCSSLGTNGEGIVKADGVTVFVPALLPEEKAEIKILKVKGNIAYGRAEEIFTPAEDRVRPRCAVFSRCGGCQLQHLKYREQLKFKTALVKDTLRKIAGIDYPVSACIRSEQEYGYRNKLQLPIGRVNGANVVGFYAERSHRIVKTDECPIHPEWSKPLIAAVYRFMETCGLEGYDEETGEGQLRHIVVRELHGKFIVTLVSAERNLSGLDFFAHLLDGIFKNNYSLVLNVNDRRTNVIFGDEFIPVKGRGTYECTDCGVVFEAGANTFVQVNENIRPKLYEAAASYVEKGETVIDCYSGGGLLTALFAKKSGTRAYGIEVVPEASACADALKRKNGLDGLMTNICGKVEDKLGEVLSGVASPVIVLDPPRAGAERSVLKEILRRDVGKIIMISCNPATMARDVGILTGALIESETGELVKSDFRDGKYDIRCIQPFDMFPQTKHVETLVVLSKKIPESHINIDVEFGEGEGQFSLKKVKECAEARKPKEKVTYKMIQDYIEQTYGFKVHTAYIAEVKRDLGFPMYDAPNAVEKLKRPRAHPTPRMVEAIKETLKHFNIFC